MQPVSTESSLSLRSRLGLVILLLLVAALAVTPVLDQRAAQNYESLFQRALVTFALARTLKACSQRCRAPRLLCSRPGLASH